MQVSLEEAQEDLRDTEYDRWHDDQTDMLDNLADEVEDFWERIMDDLKKNIDGSLDNILKMVTDNPDAVARALDALGLGDALSIITAYNPDGTHSDKAIEYGGNSYESTYNKDGENTANKFKPDSEKKTEDSKEDDFFERAQEAAKRIAEEAAKARDEEAKRAAEEAVRKAQEKEAEEAKAQAQTRKDNAVNAAYARADSIMRQSEDGAKNFVIDKVPMEGVRAVVEEFLNSSTLHKPTTDAGKKRMKTDPLLKYIAENYNGKTLSNVNEARLGAFLGIPVKDKNNVTTSEANKILKAFKNAGFAEGGIAGTLNRAAIENGDDGLITIQRGEAVLTKGQTEAVQNMADRFVRAEPQFTPEQTEYLKGTIGIAPAATRMMENMAKAAQSIEVTNNNMKAPNVNVGDINVHLDGSGVVDMESMFQQLNQPRNRQRMWECVLGDIKSPFQNILKRF